MSAAAHLQRHTCRAELVSRAWSEALSMACPGPGPGRGSFGELAADALRAHSALSAGLGRSVPVTGLEPGGDGVRGLAVFLAVYAGYYGQQDACDFGTAA
ncbi:hypothetical protein [Streptomyces sp. DH24]|uniref:hypothetical protein n=1 Tax=Streptomyces sp. DH24 TaxID=3040123 RepID=UPI0024410D5B|nr:hypothetical protein [Streptomyces sp. DH24]MDG9720193.1 hypothetical protein [Streptomyces sp. DH24]